MDREVLIEIIRAAPTALLLLALLFAIARFAEPVRKQVLPRLTELQLFGVKINLKPEDIQAAVDKAGGEQAPQAVTALMRRAQVAGKLWQGRQILWVDDNPRNNVEERRLLEAIGVDVECALSTAEAIVAIERRPSPPEFDLVLSDMRRGDDGQAGIGMVRAFGERGIELPVIFYAGGYDPARGVPKGAIAMTNRPVELLNHVMDALERQLPKTQRIPWWA